MVIEVNQRRVLLRVIQRNRSVPQPACVREVTTPAAHLRLEPIADERSARIATRPAQRVHLLDERKRLGELSAQYMVIPGVEQDGQQSFA